MGRRALLLVVLTLSLLPAVAVADMGGPVMLLGLLLLIPLLIIGGFVLSYFWNCLVMSLSMKLDKKDFRISDVLVFNLGYTFIVGVAEVVMYLVLIFFLGLGNPLIFHVLGFVTNGIIIFFVFRFMFSRWFPKKFKADDRTINKYSVAMAIITNPAFIFVALLLIPIGFVI